MTIVLIIIAVIAAIYVYGAIAYYYSFKHWNPLCGCMSKSGCNLKKS